MTPTNEKLTIYQKWVLLYFLKNKDSTPKFEDLADNMCLSAISQFDTKKFQSELNELVDRGLVEIDESMMPITYQSTLNGRLYVKQKILLPLINARNKHQINDILTYMRNDYDGGIIDQIQNAMDDRDQNNFLAKLTVTALNNISPFLDILDKITNELSKLQH